MQTQPQLTVLLTLTPLWMQQRAPLQRLLHAVLVRQVVLLAVAWVRLRLRWRWPASKWWALMHLHLEPMMEPR